MFYESAPGCPGHDISAPGQASDPVETPASVAVVCADDGYRKQLTATIDAEGHLVFSTGSLSTALATLASRPADVLVIVAGDGSRPPVEQIRTARIDGKPALLVVLPDADAETGMELLRAGADQVVTGRPDADDLRLRVTSLLRAAREHEQTEWAKSRRAELSRGLLVFADLATQVSVAQGFDDLLASAAHAAVHLAPSRNVTILLRTHRPDELMVTYAQGQRFGPLGTRIDARGEPYASAMSSDQPFARDIDTSEHPSRIQIVYVPLYVSDVEANRRCTGLLCVAGRLGGATYTASDLEFLQLLANRAAAALEQAVNQFWHDQARHALVRALLSLTEKRDEDTGDHIDRVTAYALLLADELRNLPEYADAIDGDFLRNLRWTTSLHDIGKVAVPDSILLKRGPLTEAERQIMQQHAAIGADTLRAAQAGLPSSPLLRMAEQIARYHHENHDGRGYPERLTGPDIPLAAQIVALADVYDALRTTRPYKPAYPHEQVIAMISEQRGKRFSPDLVDAFLRRHEEFATVADLGTGQGPRGLPTFIDALQQRAPWWLLPDPPDTDAAAPGTAAPDHASLSVS